MAYCHDTPTDLGTVLGDHGITPQAPQAVPLVDCLGHPPFPGQTDHAPVRVFHPEGLQAAAKIQEQVLGEPQSSAHMERFARRIGEGLGAFFRYLSYVG